MSGDGSDLIQRILDEARSDNSDVPESLGSDGRRKINKINTVRKGKKVSINLSSSNKLKDYNPVIDPKNIDATGQPDYTWKEENYVEEERKWKEKYNKAKKAQFGARAEL